MREEGWGGALLSPPRLAGGGLVPEAGQGVPLHCVLSPVLSDVPLRTSGRRPSLCRSHSPGAGIVLGT